MTQDKQIMSPPERLACAHLPPIQSLTKLTDDKYAVITKSNNNCQNEQIIKSNRKIKYVRSDIMLDTYV